MAELIKGKVQHLYETATTLATKNRTLLAGLIGIESDTGKFKFGDGSTTWNALPYAVGGGTDWSSDETYKQGDVSTHAKDQWISKEDNNTEEPGTGTKWTQDSRLTWLEFRKYYTTSFVNHSGKWWTAIQDSEGVEPGTDTDTWIEGAFNSGSGKEIGELFFSAVPVEQSGCKWADYSRLSQSIYAPLFAKIGHLYAKTSADATSAEAAGLFHIPDAMFLFPRGGKSWNITDAEIDISLDRILLSTHGITAEDNGRPIKLQRIPGTSPTLPSGITEYDQYYLRYVDADYIELYSSEEEAVKTTETTGRVDFTTTGSGSFLLTTMGCYQSSALQGHGHNIIHANGETGDTIDTSNGIPQPEEAGYVLDPADSENTYFGSVTVTNESRGPSTSLGMQIKVVDTSVSTVAPQGDTMSSSMSYEITANTVDYLIDSSSVSSGQTLTLSRGLGANVKNRVILNNESANSVTVTDGTTVFTALADSINTYYFNNTELKEGSW